VEAIFAREVMTLRAARGVPLWEVHGPCGLDGKVPAQTPGRYKIIVRRWLAAASPGAKPEAARP